MLMYRIGDERQSEDYEAVEPIIIHIESATCVALKDIANVGMARGTAWCWPRRRCRSFNMANFTMRRASTLLCRANFLTRRTRQPFAGGRQSEGGRSADDDGRRCDQVTAVRTGGCNGGRREVPNPVSLRPFRTFIEVDQPRADLFSA